MDRLRVLSLNIWNRLGPWEDRLRLIRRGLVELTPDLVGLQEVLRHEAEPMHQAQIIADGLGYHAAFHSAWAMGGGLHFGNALLSRFPIVGADGFALPCEPGDESRALLYCEVDAPCGRVPVFVTHLSWRLDQSLIRTRQVLAISERIRENAPPLGFPPILMGDFNAEPDSDEIRFLKGLTALGGKGASFVDCFAAAADEDRARGATFARRNRYADRAGEPDRRLDYIFVRGPDPRWRGRPLSARVVLDQPEGGVFASDHFGVFAELQATPQMP
jgi:endonuclease/exonuclease/phosphatase family metal-dependent hydrolase